MTAYYNEFDPKAAAWLRQLITNGDIAPGEVDERSIIDVEASDLKGFTQHHFFAGIGVWSYSLRNAGWADDRPVCTASLPCQPFSAAGNKKGKEDERHLLPHFLELVRQCGFHTIFGEQVESAISHEWLDDLQTVMERENYAVGHCVLGAHSVNAAHIRKRLYWVANSINQRSQRRLPRWQDSEREDINRHTGCGSTDSRVVDSISSKYRCQKRGLDEESSGAEVSDRTEIPESRELSGASEYVHESIDWLYCRDNKYRPIKSGIKPLVDGFARGMVHSSDSIITPNASAEARTLRLKGYGNALVSGCATVFIKSVMEVLNEKNM